MGQGVRVRQKREELPTMYIEIITAPTSQYVGTGGVGTGEMCSLNSPRLSHITLHTQCSPTVYRTCELITTDPVCSSAASGCTNK